eukprot:g5789.t1
MIHNAIRLTKGLSAVDKYLFDTNGYIVLRGVFSSEFVNRANSAIDERIAAGDLHERKGKLRTSGLYGRESGPLQGDGVTGRADMGGMLGWDGPGREPFREVLAHPRLAPALNDMLGTGYRLDHSPLLLTMEKGADGHTMHGGAITESGDPAWPIAYYCRNGHIRTELLTVCVQLSEAPEGAGGFCAVPGSHKSNFPVPPAFADLSEHEEHVRQPVLSPGDVLLFTEALLHGTLPWLANHQRRTCIYRFAPAGSAYGRGYNPMWPESFTDGMSEEQLATMEAPYHTRMSRKSIRTQVDNNGTESCEVVIPEPREDFKVEFDEQVFKTKYF